MYLLQNPILTILARDRINMLLDPDTPFLELCIFAGYKQPGSSPSASVIAGIGVVKYPSFPLSHYRLIIAA
jgi:acetyl-CoA carboxylase carboxyltransferase component